MIQARRSAKRPDYTIKIQPDGTIVFGPTVGVESVDFSYVSLGMSFSAMLW